MLILQVGQTATLVFTPNVVGVQPAEVSSVEFLKTQGGNEAAVTFTPPDQVAGAAAGTSRFRCRVLLVPDDKISYRFEVQCVAPAVPAPEPVVVPVVLDNLVTPAPPEQLRARDGARTVETRP